MFVFLSTLSLRRATVFVNLGNIATTNFYPRSPCGERPSDVPVMSLTEYGFLSTLSLRRATTRHDLPPGGASISIHALLAESDGKSNKLAGLELVFLSTLSLRRATNTADQEARKRLISIHALLAESDIRKCQVIPIIQISIHALLAESDRETTSIKPIFSISIHALLAESD